MAKICLFVCFLSLLVCCDLEYQYSGIISTFFLTLFIGYLSKYTQER